jgi:hypothetical protein
MFSPRRARSKSARAKNAENRKFEARNSKQIQMLKTQKIPNQVLRIRVLDFLGFWVYLAAVCFGFGASDFGFYGDRILAREVLLN